MVFLSKLGDIVDGPDCNTLTVRKENRQLEAGGKRLRGLDAIRRCVKPVPMGLEPSAIAA
jgi:hypothetical protein